MPQYLYYTYIEILRKVKGIDEDHSTTRDRCGYTRKLFDGVR